METSSTLAGLWRSRIKACAIHLLLSVLLAGFAGVLVFWLWYPYPYREISGGTELFLLVVSVDVVLGPLITFAVFDRRKSWSTLRRDLAVVALLQASALAYGLWTVAIARPVYMVFEIDRFRIVHAVEIDPVLLDKAPMALRTLPWSGPKLLGVRPFRDQAESMEATLAAVQGVHLALQPNLWQPYTESASAVLLAAKPINHLLKRFPESATRITQMLVSLGRTPEQAVTLPLVGRHFFWTVIIDPDSGNILATFPLDSF